MALGKDLKFEKGKSRLYGETDIVRLVTILRNFEVTQRALLDDREIKLAELQRNQVISSVDDASSSEYDIYPGKNWSRHHFDKKQEDIKAQDGEEMFFAKLKEDMLAFANGKELEEKQSAIINGLVSKRLANTINKEAKEKEKRAEEAMKAKTIKEQSTPDGLVKTE